jgi:hypothetical protein
MALHIAAATNQRKRRSLREVLRPIARRSLPACKLGAVRTVFITRHYVFKLPGRWILAHWRWWWDSLLRGLLSNMQERAFAAEGWPSYVP